MLEFDSQTFRNCPIENLYLGRNISDGYYYNYSPFSDNKALKTLTIGNSVTEIGESAFKGCTGINTLTIGNSVTEIGVAAFNGCSSITSVTSLNQIPPAITESTFDEMTEKNATLHVPEGCKAAYWINPYWENFFNIQDDVPTSIEYISTDSQEKQVKNKGIYTLNGTKVNMTNISDLPSGVYIINGKKIVVK